jgi:hypothetical protein
MEMQASVASNLAMVEKSVHPRILHHLSPLLQLIHKMVKMAKKVEKEVKTMSEASRRPPLYLFGAS